MQINSKIPFGDISLIPPRDLSNIPEDIYSATFYKSTSSTPTNLKIHLVNTYSTTSVKTNSGSTSDPIPPLNLSDFKIRQQIWIHIFNYKQDPKYLKRYNDNRNQFLKAK